jgi:predicted RNase H-like nuclease (RuvC/YqgF family)
MKFFNSFMREYENVHVKITDQITGTEYSLVDTIYNLIKKIEEQENKIKNLEQENIETTNQIYELQNRLDLLEQTNSKFSM